jgi:hypothetical protein
MLLVYDISIISNIPLSVFDLLDPPAPTQRLRPLFTIGVHDIPWLVEDNEAAKRVSEASRDESKPDDESGWIACTTDSILAMKEDLWDVLITMPPSFAANAPDKVWPTVECPKGHRIKATQRDLRRFRTLKAGLARLAARSRQESAPTTPKLNRPSTSSGRSFFEHLADDAPRDADPITADASENLVEPITWAALAYSGFMWWASAGEQRRAEEVEEQSQDAGLLADLAPPMMPGQPLHRGGAGLEASVASLAPRRPSRGQEDASAESQPPRPTQDEDEDKARTELAIIAYFHRLTTRVMSVLADLVESTGDDDDDSRFGMAVGDENEEALLQSDDESEGSGGAGAGAGVRGIRVDGEALTRMGLDIWSEADADFVKDLTARYFARRAVVESKGVDVCGMRIC